MWLLLDALYLFSLPGMGVIPERLFKSTHEGVTCFGKGLVNTANLD